MRPGDHFEDLRQVVDETPTHVRAHRDDAREVTTAVAKVAVIGRRAKARFHVFGRTAFQRDCSFVPTAESDIPNLTPWHATAAQAAAETPLPFWHDCLRCLALPYVTRSRFNRFTPTLPASVDATICHMTWENETF